MVAGCYAQPLNIPVSYTHLANLQTALRIVQKVLQACGTDISMRKVLVDSEETARKFRLWSSPTIRMNGRDIALKFLETPCDSCARACACDGGLDCRVWAYEGEEYTEAPVPLIVSALLLEICDSQSSHRPTPNGPFELSENLKHFFEAKAAKKAAESCCAAEEKTNCCETVSYTHLFWEQSINARGSSGSLHGQCLRDKAR